VIVITENKKVLYKGDLFVKTEGSAYFFGPENNKGVRELSTDSRIPLLSPMCKIITLEVGKKLAIQYYPLKSRDPVEQREQICQREIVNLIERDD
jgi:hypothetical protein